MTEENEKALILLESDLTIVYLWSLCLSDLQDQLKGFANPLEQSV